LEARTIHTRTRRSIVVAKKKQARYFFPLIALLLTLWVTMTGCGGAPTPNTMPTLAPQPTSQLPPTFTLEVSPGTEVQVGKSVAIVAKVEPLEELDLKWMISGTAEGMLNTDTGEQVVYTAGKDGVDIVVAEGTTASGLPVKQTVSLTVVAQPMTEPPTTSPLPTDTPSSIEEPTEEPTAEPTKRPECPFGSPVRLPIAGPSVDAEVRISSVEHCADNLPTATAIPLAGNYSGDMTNKEIWILVYPPNLVYYPQSTNACASLSTPFDSGQWQEQIRLGRQGVPEAFHVVAVVAEVGSPASEAFHNYLTVGCDTGNYEAIAVIPSGATEMDSIVVHTE
jgi:hypothetical protein